MKKWTILDPSLHFGSPNHELSFKLFLSLNQLVSLQNYAM
jgi:hypothetical protein